MPHMLPSTVPSVSASAKFFLSRLNPPPHPITVYASHPPSPTTAQHSLPGGPLPSYRGRSFTGRIASASPDAPELKVRIQLPPAESRANFQPNFGDSSHFGAPKGSGQATSPASGRTLEDAVSPSSRHQRSSCKSAVRHGPNNGGYSIGFGNAEHLAPNHSFRHYLKSELLARDVPERISDAITGHKTPGIGRKYEHVPMSKKFDAIDKLPVISLQAA
jgi:hypothetical protein